MIGLGPHIPYQRLRNQRLAASPLLTPAEVVRWLGAVQAQDYASALWAIGLRMVGTSEDEVERAIADRSIIRTWFMRGTLHFVPAEDIRWLLSLMAPRMRRLLANTGRYNRVELDETAYARSNAILVAALQGGKQLTRAELAGALEDAGFSTAGLRLSFALQRAQADGLLCYAARRGKQHTLALIDEWAPPGRSLAGDGAQAEFTRRYFASHGPATVHDFAWWSGFTVAEARSGLDMLRSELEHEDYEGQTYWSGAQPVAAGDDVSETAYLLPNYDEYTVGYQDRSAVFDAAQVEPSGPPGTISLAHVIVIGGQVVGTWRRTLSKGAVAVETQPFTPFTAAEAALIAAAARRYADFLGLSLALR